MDDFGCTLKVYRRSILNELRIYGEMHRFVPALAHQIGARIAEIEVNHRPRISGRSNYGLDRVFRVILDLLTVNFFLKFTFQSIFEINQLLLLIIQDFF